MILQERLPDFFPWQLNFYFWWPISDLWKTIVNFEKISAEAFS